MRVYFVSPKKGVRQETDFNFVLYYFINRETFSKTWQKDLSISVMLLNKKNPDSLVKLLDPSVVWQGSLVISEVLLHKGGSNSFLVCAPNGMG